MDTVQFFFNGAWTTISYRHRHPDSKVHGDNMGPIWGRQDPGGPHVGPMNLAIWAVKATMAFIY